MKAFCSRVFVFAFLAIFTLLTHGASKPNIILFVSDDMGWNDVGYHGSKIATPHIDRLVKDGMQLDRFYVHPICSPTRAALMTGRLPVRFGITAALTRGAGVSKAEHFMPQTFQKAGYQTAVFGKWHLSSRPKGFETFKVTPGQGAWFDPVFFSKNNQWYGKKKKREVVPGEKHTGY